MLSLKFESFSSSFIGMSPSRLLLEIQTGVSQYTLPRNYGGHRFSPISPESAMKGGERAKGI